ncbi:putative reverse transcriptase zinc-binding domain-containing protein [Medicago truncatula]|uniref:Putative reverse transcriptase zinc-binding domain-containing protein n=1 Tax=Medicago truncatula TaxID=3880 RepID=A0A396HVN9_MEDTR|nr:putative reverse transcriptase zinc-binding domain-containing protein [Medicago truncatula]
MCHLGWGVGGEAWTWRRRLFVWEEGLFGDLILLLQNVNLQVAKVDKWLWTLESSGVFTVRSAYNYLTLQPPLVLSVDACFLWHRDIPLKVVLFAWRLFRDRLPTKDNLFRRGVINQTSRLCVAGCGSLETSNHLFLHCNFFGSVWHFIHRWLGLSVASPFQVSDHFNQFSLGGGFTKAHRSILQVIWYAVVWEIWKERNNMLFNVKECSVNQVVDNIKSLAFTWLKAKYSSLPLNYHGWWISPFTIMGIG